MFAISSGYLSLRFVTLTFVGSLSFAYTHPMSCWVSSILTCFAGTIMANFLLGNALILPLLDMKQIAILTVIW